MKFSMDSLKLLTCLSLSLSLSDSEMLRYAYAELEESRGAIQVLRFLALKASLSCS